MATRRPSCMQFLTACNGRAHTRIFASDDYTGFCEALRHARHAAKRGKPFYAWDHAGAVANNYGYVTDTARWGVWSLPDGTVEWRVDRVTIKSRSVPHPYHGGMAAYLRDFKHLHPRTGETLTAMSTG